MKTTHSRLAYQLPNDADILEAYLYKSESHNRTNAQRVKRALRKLKYA